MAVLETSERRKPTLVINSLSSTKIFVDIITIFYSLFPGNLIADIMRNVTQADVSLVNSGTLRSDTVHPPGEFKMKVSQHI